MYHKNEHNNNKKHEELLKWNAPKTFVDRYTMLIHRYWFTEKTGLIYMLITLVLASMVKGSLRFVLIILIMLFIDWLSSW